VETVAIVAALGLAFVLGVSDAPNATSALVATRTAAYRTAAAFAFVFHLAGALLGGTAVAVTVNGLIDVGAGDVPAAYAAGCLAAVLFVAGATRLGIPTSASFGLVAGLVGAALVAGGIGAVEWGGLDGLHPVGTLGVLIGLVVSPFLGLGVAWVARRLIGIGLRRASRRALGPVRATIWIGAAAVAVSDGTNDGQKAMGIAAGVLLATGSLQGFSIPLWVRASVAVTLALGTAIGGRRIVRTVGIGYYRGGPVDGLGSQGSAAGVILGCSALGFPISTSTVVASAVVGVGSDRRFRHVRWRTFGETVSAWVVTIPACTGLGAVLFLLFRWAG
jgi:PiT family inorganic phosphate transporter